VVPLQLVQETSKPVQETSEPVQEIPMSVETLKLFQDTPMSVEDTASMVPCVVRSPLPLEPYIDINKPLLLQRSDCLVRCVQDIIKSPSSKVVV